MASPVGRGAGAGKQRWGEPHVETQTPLRRVQRAGVWFLSHYFFEAMRWAKPLWDWVGTGQGKPHRHPSSLECPSCHHPASPLAAARAPLYAPATSFTLPPAPSSAAPAVWHDPSACGGLQWPHPCRRPPPSYPGGGPAGEGYGEGRAEAAQGPACLPHAPPLCCRVA